MASSSRSVFSMLSLSLSFVFCFVRAFLETRNTAKSVLQITSLSSLSALDTWKKPPSAAVSAVTLSSPDEVKSEVVEDGDQLEAIMSSSSSAPSAPSVAAKAPRRANQERGKGRGRGGGGRGLGRGLGRGEFRGRGRGAQQPSRKRGRFDSQDGGDDDTLSLPAPSRDNHFQQTHQKQQVDDDEAELFDIPQRDNEGAEEEDDDDDGAEREDEEKEAAEESSLLASLDASLQEQLGGRGRGGGESGRGG